MSRSTQVLSRRQRDELNDGGGVSSSSSRTDVLRNDALYENDSSVTPRHGSKSDNPTKKTKKKKLESHHTAFIIAGSMAALGIVLLIVYWIYRSMKKNEDDKMLHTIYDNDPSVPSSSPSYKQKAVDAHNVPAQVIASNNTKANQPSVINPPTTQVQAAAGYRPETRVQLGTAGDQITRAEYEAAAAVDFQLKSTSAQLESIAQRFMQQGGQFRQQTSSSKSPASQQLAPDLLADIQLSPDQVAERLDIMRRRMSVNQKRSKIIDADGKVVPGGWPFKPLVDHALFLDGYSNNLLPMADGLSWRDSMRGQLKLAGTPYASLDLNKVPEWPLDYEFPQRAPQRICPTAVVAGDLKHATFVPFGSTPNAKCANFNDTFIAPTGDLIKWNDTTHQYEFVATRAATPNYPIVGWSEQFPGVPFPPPGGALLKDNAGQSYPRINLDPTLGWGHLQWNATGKPNMYVWRPDDGANGDIPPNYYVNTFNKDRHVQEGPQFVYKVPTKSPQRVLPPVQKAWIMDHCESENFMYLPPVSSAASGNNTFDAGSQKLISGWCIETCDEGSDLRFWAPPYYSKAEVTPSWGCLAQCPAGTQNMDGVCSRRLENPEFFHLRTSDYGTKDEYWHFDELFCKSPDNSVWGRFWGGYCYDAGLEATQLRNVYEYGPLRFRTSSVNTCPIMDLSTRLYELPFRKTPDGKRCYRCSRNDMVLVGNNMDGYLCGEPCPPGSSESRTGTTHQCIADWVSHGASGSKKVSMYAHMTDEDKRQIEDMRNNAILAAQIAKDDARRLAEEKAEKDRQDRAAAAQKDKEGSNKS